jgi:hypothetical protein
MLTRDDAQRLLLGALGEFARDWEPVGDVTEVTSQDPNHWLSGAGTFGVILRHRTTQELKVLGRRSGPQPASYHRGISHLVLQAYSERNTDPVRRYLEEVGIGSRQSSGGRPVTFRAG